MADFAFLIGALIPTLLLSRLALCLLSKWKAGMPKIVVANVASLLVTALVAAFGMADGGPPQFGPALGTYALPQLVWLVLDAFRFQKIGAVTIAPWKFK